MYDLVKGCEQLFSVQKRNRKGKSVMLDTVEEWGKGRRNRVGRRGRKWYWTSSWAYGFWFAHFESNLQRTHVKQVERNVKYQEIQACFPFRAEETPPQGSSTEAGILRDRASEPGLTQCFPTPWPLFTPLNMGLKCKQQRNFVHT